MIWPDLKGIPHIHRPPFCGVSERFLFFLLFLS
uniref:Uncharacterized protein n=1 Tax=Siphoviridae sp. ctbrg2 TaxID=2823589 RepID=A0A8S5LFT2_9CAUD|nr:MAG TPA: hypothetical protein [Siphoviridae sp. ctbrg2]